MLRLGSRARGKRTNSIDLLRMRARYSGEEFARRGDEIYEREVLQHVRPEDKGKIVAIDVETGAFAVDANELAASDRLRARNPDAQIWFRRIGYRHVHRIGVWRA